MSPDLPAILFPALGFVLGAIVGSFLATVLIRWPRGESVVTGRSRCDSCQARLSSAQMIPILSYLVARGRCRHCGAAIDSRHLTVELAAAGIGLVALAAHPIPLALGIVTALLGFWLLLIALLDLEHHWLPDRLTLPLIPLGLLAAALGFGPSLLDRLLGAAFGWGALALIALAYRRLRGREGMGGGDPKLLGGIGAWLGVYALPFVLLGAGMLGLAAVLLMLARGESVARTSRLPLGTLMAVASWPIWLVLAL